ncbi:hypothetical protein J1G44_03250 [Cellulomonas sp. zg-ZUI199]|uniref:Uncharacterized protein n=1 Tax=Cellulomonas wangleii TaxID=2816956 RepID=A0ABX8D2Y4_9CELL|nr:hypothetical protein [Cellulomonas wangleii]MBO0923495.1 hypothetical protein [Cellulomonas wangleii]QVI61837.1 hypothetical protein KG103_15535 [Cellulomonas wangleii]
MTDRTDSTGGTSTTAREAARAGYAFANEFVNVVATLPGGVRVRTAGRCGGMSFSVLDHLAAGRDAPSWPPALFAPGRVPPDGHLVADHLRARQLDSFRSASALRFLTWSVLPDADVGPLAGVRTRTCRELPRVLRALAEGHPVVLGLVVARTLVRSGDNHQVVATGFVRDPVTGAVTLTVLDPNSPRREVTLHATADGWRADDGRLWRGFFAHTYRPRTPPPLPGASRRPGTAVRPDASLALVHVATGRRLVVADGVPALRAQGTTTWAPSAPRTGRGLADGALVLLVAAGDAPRALTLGPDGPALADPPAGAGAPGGHDAPGPEAWRVVVEGGGAWREGSRVRLLHAATGALLRGTGDRLGSTFTPDAQTWWTVGS